MAGLVTGGAQAAPKFPALTGRVVDEAHLLDAATSARLTQQLAMHEQQTGEQLVVATVPDLQGYDIAEYGYQLGRTWGIGQKGKDNGALLIVAPKERDVRIEVGYGLEDKLTDAMSQLIIDRTMLPHFKTGDYAGGIEGGVQSILAVLGGGELPAELKQQPESTGGSLPPFGILLIIGLFILMRLFARRGMGGGLLPFILGGFLGSRGRGGGDDDFGGGGFSGGGGSFGGGGASSKW